jgi:hypothetical protein
MRLLQALAAAAGVALALAGCASPYDTYHSGYYNSGYYNSGYYNRPAYSYYRPAYYQSGYYAPQYGYYYSGPPQVSIATSY